VQLDGVVLFAQGPNDGLEVLACLEGGKNHESFARLLTGNAELVKSAFITALGLDEDGVPAPEMSALPARGFPVRVQAYWRPDLLMAPDKWVRCDASSLVRDRVVDQGYPALPYVYTGSRIQTVEQMLPDGSVRKVRRFMLGDTRSVAVNFDEADALLASPSPFSMRDNVFEVNSQIGPPAETKVHLVFTRAELPLSLEGDAEGLLYHGGSPLDEGQVIELLRRHYGAGAEPEQRAVAIALLRSVPRSVDVALRKRVLRLAAEAEAWVVPIFVDAGPAAADGL